MSSIKQRPNGQWRARYRDESGKEHARHFPRKTDAQRWLDEVTASVVTGNYVDPRAGKVTFRRFFDEWSGRQVWKPGTAAAMKLAALSTPFVDLPLANIRRSHVEAWIRAMDRKGLAPGTIHTRYVNVRSVFRAAVMDRVITHDPTDRITLPRRRKQGAAMSIPTPEQVGKLVNGSEDRFKAFVALCAFAGLRLGEAAALQVGDVDFLRRTVDVKRQVQRVNGGRVDVRAPKYESERVVFVPKQLTDLLAAHIAKHCPDDTPERWIFPLSGGNPVHQNTVAHMWRGAKSKSGVDGFKLHDLRHFYASGLIAAGCDVVTVQRALGHAKPTTTLNTYSHLWPNAEDRTRTAAADLMATSLANLADSARTEQAN